MVIASRSFQNDDWLKINDLYKRVTGRQRTQSQYMWQWRRAPAGPGYIYLIEYRDDPKNEIILVGHHGIMPIRFSNGSDDWIAGKTENTMVDPAYRDQLIYPRFESRFKRSYSANCDVLFSTTGPKEAIRQRTAHGYKEVGEWKTLLLSSRRALSTSSIHRFARSRSKKHCLMPLDLAAIKSIPFDDFWQKCRCMYPLTTSRASKDIQWRFVDNPYHDYLISIFWNQENAQEIDGFSIIRLPQGKAPIAMIEDIIVVEPSVAQFDALLRATLGALFLKNIYLARLPFVLDRSTASNQLLLAADPLVSSLVNTRRKLDSLLGRSRLHNSTGMMRWVAPSRINDVRIDDWYITGTVLEGR